MCGCVGPKFWLVLLVFWSFAFFAAQFLMSNVSGCLALKSYSYHVLSDALSLFVGLLSFLKHNSTPDNSYFTNTYGWVRIELVGSLISHVVIISLCFSSVVDSLQYIISPEEGLQAHKLTVVAMGGLGLFVHLSVIFYSLLIRCCSRNESPTKVCRALSHQTVEGVVSPTSTTLSKWDAFSSHAPIPSSGFNAFCLPFLHQCCRMAGGPQAASSASDNGLTVKEGAMVSSVSKYRVKAKAQSVSRAQRSLVDYWAMLLHMGIGLLASIMIVLDGLVFFFVNDDWANYIDPLLGLIIIGIVVANVTPLMVQSALTLIQHIPENIDVVALQKQLMKDIPQIVQIHDIHVWRLEGKKIMATIHVVFEGIKNEQHYTKVSKKIKAYFHKWDIHSLTFQPEFKSPTRRPAGEGAASLGAPTNGMARSETVLSTDCLYECASPKCARDTCCGSNAERRLARAHEDLPNNFPQQRGRVTKRGARDIIREAEEEEEVLEYLMLQSEWRRLHRNNRWSSSAGILTPSTSKQRVDSVSGDVELDVIVDDAANESKTNDQPE